MMKNNFTKLITVLSLFIGFILSSNSNVHFDRIKDIVVSYDNKFCVTADLSGYINVWDLSMNEIVNSYSLGDEMELYRISISPDNSMLAIGFEDGRITLLNLIDEGQKTLKLEGGSNKRIEMLKFISNNELITYQDDDFNINFWKLISKDDNFINIKLVLMQKLIGPETSASYLLNSKINRTNKIILGRLKNKDFSKWDIEQKKIIKYSDKGSIVHKQEVVDAIVEDPIITNSYEIIKSPSRSGWKHDPYDYYQYAISPDGFKVAIAFHDENNVIIWNSLFAEKEIYIDAHKYRVLDMEFSNDGKFIATSSIDKTLKIWSAYTGELIKTIQLDNDFATDIAFSLQKIIYGTFKGKIVMEDLN